MIYSRKEHYLFLEEELRAQTDQFKQKLETSATYMLNVREELFISQFVKIENGEMILKFSTSRGLPRKGEYLYCFTTPNHLHKFKEWGTITYGDLLKSKGFSTELVCIWQASLKDDPNHCLVGFRGVDIEFAEHVDGHPGAFLILGPNVPPTQYISNLQHIIKNNTEERIEQLIEGNIDLVELEPVSLDNNTNVSDFIITQLNLTDDIILQGPPGTGKTYQIATICKKLCERGFSVLVTALTNRALMEVASKDELKDLLKNGRIHKTKVSVDEAKELPELECVKALSAEPGQIMLSTFYVTSGEAKNVADIPSFDYVIMDEASQSLLGMCVAVKLLGRKCIFVGDTNQLAPVIAINEDRIERRNYHFYANGLYSLTGLANIPSYRLSSTYRLTHRATLFTGLFYNGTLVSRSETKTPFYYEDLVDSVAKFFHPQGGPTLLKTNLPLGDKKPSAALLLTTLLVSALLGRKEKLHISVLTFYIETTKALQRAIYQTIGNHNNLLIDTVSRIQGLTTDVAIYVIPNTSYYRLLDRRLFNVATSRARRHTIIVTDVDIINHLDMIDADVCSFIKNIEKESFYIPIKSPSANTIGGKRDYNSEPSNSVYKTPFCNEEYNEEHSLPLLLPVYEKIKEKEDFLKMTDESSNTSNDSIFIETKIPKVEVKIVDKIDLSKFETKKKRESVASSSNPTTYIIDTNTFVDCPQIISKINRDSTIVLSAKVIDELDKLKITLDARGQESVKMALKNINKVTEERDIQFEVANTHLLPKDFDYRSPDNMILSVALKYKDKNPVMLTSDNGLQVKCKIVGIPTISTKKFLMNL